MVLLPSMQILRVFDPTPVTVSMPITGSIVHTPGAVLLGTSRETSRPGVGAATSTIASMTPTPDAWSPRGRVGDQCSPTG
jgi:hypothetical protein